MIIFPSASIGADPAFVVLEDLIIGADDEFGTHLTLAPSDDWYGGAGVRRPGRQDRPGADGAFPSPGHLEGLPLVLAGKGRAQDQVSALRSIRRMRATLSTGDRSGVLSWFDPDESVILSCLVERDGPWRIRNFSTTVFEWQVALFAPDPRRYAEPQSVTTSLAGGGIGLALDFGGDLLDSGTLGSDGIMTVINDGTAPTEPQFTITAPMASGFQLTHLDTGRVIVYPEPVISDVVVDCQEGTVTSGGQDRTGLLSRDEFFTIGAGESAQFQFATLGGETADSPCTATVLESPAYA